MKPKLTIIICATDLAQAYDASQSVVDSSDVDCLVLIHDNTQFKWPISKVYNTYGRLSQADSLLLIHQDVKFTGIKWSSKILNKLKERDCGAIGFAGSVAKLKDCFAGWPINVELSRNNYAYKSLDRIVYHHRSNDFDRVVTLDGLAIFCKKKTLIDNPFDEKLVTGFHCYDIDFSMALHKANLKNYVFVDRCMTPIHLSPGNYDKIWALETIKFTLQKWNDMLPMSVINIPEDEQKKLALMKNLNFIEVIKKHFSMVDSVLILESIHLDNFKKLEDSIKVKFNMQSSVYESWV